MNQDQDVRRALQKWQVKSVPSPRFEDRVWSRIAQAETVRNRTSVMGWLSELFRRPAWALSYCALVLALGAGIGYAQADRAKESARMQYQAMYLQTVNPYVATGSFL